MYGDGVEGPFRFSDDSSGHGIVCDGVSANGLVVHELELFCDVPEVLGTLYEMVDVIYEHVVVRFVALFDSCCGGRVVTEKAVELITVALKL